MKAKARRASLETAKTVNRHLDPAARLRDSDLEEKVYEWFDGLDLKSLSVIQRVFPGKETLKETLRLLNEGASKDITRGQVVASISPEVVSQEMRELLVAVGEGKD